MAANLGHVSPASRFSILTILNANVPRRHSVTSFGVVCGMNSESLAQRLIELAIALQKDHDIGLGLKKLLYAMDSTTIGLCHKLFPWADFRSTKAALKAHTMIDLRGAIPEMLTITAGKAHNVKGRSLYHIFLEHAFFELKNI